MVLNSPQLRAELEHRVLARTGWQVLNLVVEFLPERIILRGRANSFYVKQLAQQAVKEYLPDVRLENGIQVAT